MHAGDEDDNGEEEEDQEEEDSNINIPDTDDQQQADGSSIKRKRRSKVEVTEQLSELEKQMEAVRQGYTWKDAFYQQNPSLTPSSLASKQLFKAVCAAFCFSFCISAFLFLLFPAACFVFVVFCACCFFLIPHDCVFCLNWFFVASSHSFRFNHSCFFAFPFINSWERRERVEWMRTQCCRRIRSRWDS